MDKQDFQKSACRLCLAEHAEQNWNAFLDEQGKLTYKDCYYKFTGLECFDMDILPTMLCRNCCNCLKNMNIFISKAIENHYFLLEKSSLLKKDNEDLTSVASAIDCKAILVEEVEIKPDVDTLEQYREQFLKENETCSSSERLSSPLAQTVLDQKPIETKAEDIFSLNQLRNTEMPPKKTSKIRKIPTSCSICSKVLVSKPAAIKHEKTHLKNRERSVVCPECGLKFYCKIALRNHAQVHSENRKTYKCENCDKSFLHRGGLNIHRRIHLGQMIPCTLCSKQFYRIIDLDKHMPSHSAPTISGDIIRKKKIMVRCEVCGENVRSTNYKSHTAKHMNEPLLKCSLCDKNFFCRESCVTHLKKFHNKGNGEREDFIIKLKANRRCTSLFMQQNTSKIFIEK